MQSNARGCLRLPVRVHSKPVETQLPNIADNTQSDMSSSRTTALTSAYRSMLDALRNDEFTGVPEKTPRRAAEALEFLTKGYTEQLDEVIHGALFESDIDEIIVVKDIQLYSLCEHHVLPFIGKCHVGYLPNGHVLGLSKIARIVDLYARRLQIQERLTQQIAHAIESATRAAGIGVVIEAQHLCTAMRGVQKQNSTMKTSVMLGSFRESAPTRAEFLQLLY